jgi:histone H3/H4
MKALGEAIEDKLKEVIEISCAIMTEGNSKTLHDSDVHHALELLGDYTTQASSE